MTRKLTVVLLAAALAAGAAPTFPAEGDGAGRLEVFLFAASRPPRPVTVVIGGVGAATDSGAVLELALQVSRVGSQEVTNTQKPLASGELPAGLYRGLRLRLAPAAETEEAVEISLPLDFRIEPGTPTILVLEWLPGRAADAGAFSLRRGAPTVRGLTLYVTDAGADEVVAVNRDTHEVFAKIRVGSRPRGIEVSFLGRRAYVANSGDDSVSVIDTASHDVVDTIPLKGGCAPEDLTLADDGRRLVVTCPGLNSVAVIDPLTDAYVGDAGVSRPPTRVAASRRERRVYVLMPEGNRIQAIDLVRLIPGPAAAVDAAPTDLAVDERSGTVIVTHATTPVLTSLSADLRPEREIPIGVPAHGVAIDGDARSAYVTGGPHGGLALVSLQAGTMVRRWKTDSVEFLVIDPDGRKVFAAGGDRGTLVVIDRIAGKLIGEEKIGRNTVDLAVIP